MDKRKATLEEYGISKKRYKELSGFCEQYPEWKKELEMKNSTLRSPQITGMPVSHNNADTTSELAVRRVMLEERCRLIEETAKEANSDMADVLIKAICYEVSVNYLIANGEMLCSMATFYDVRKYFYYLLNQKKN